MKKTFILSLLLLAATNVIAQKKAMKTAIEKGKDPDCLCYTARPTEWTVSECRAWFAKNSEYSILNTTTYIKMQYGAEETFVATVEFVHIDDKLTAQVRYKLKNLGVPFDANGKITQWTKNPVDDDLNSILFSNSLPTNLRTLGSSAQVYKPISAENRVTMSEFVAAFPAYLYLPYEYTKNNGRVGEYLPRTPVYGINLQINYSDEAQLKTFCGQLNASSKVPAEVKIKVKNAVLNPLPVINSLVDQEYETAKYGDACKQNTGAAYYAFAKKFPNSTKYSDVKSRYAGLYNKAVTAMHNVKEQAISTIAQRTNYGVKSTVGSVKNDFVSNFANDDPNGEMATATLLDKYYKIIASLEILQKEPSWQVFFNISSRCVDESLFGLFGCMGKTDSYSTVHYTEYWCYGNGSFETMSAGLTEINSVTASNSQLAAQFASTKSYMTAAVAKIGNSNYGYACNSEANRRTQASKKGHESEKARSRARRAAEECANCEIDDSKTILPRSQAKTITTVSDFLFGGETVIVENKPGKVVMKNGQTYDFKVGEYYWEVSRCSSCSLYRKNNEDEFKKMLEDMIKDCVEKHCK
jgi:hypothetical protein